MWGWSAHRGGACEDKASVEDICAPVAVSVPLIKLASTWKEGVLSFCCFFMSSTIS